MESPENPTDADSTLELRKKLEDLKNKYGFREPDRGNLDDPEIEWRYEKPDYTLANYEFLKGKTQNHAKGSIEELVEDLVKTWEAQASHFKNFQQWTTVDHSDYHVSANGGAKIPGKTAYEIGNYNSLMMECPAYKKYGELDFEESHHLFRNAFKKGFPWEVLKVLSKPPHVVFTWRHWGEFVGEYRGNKGKGETIEMFGVMRVTLSEDLKIQYIEVFYDPETFIQVMEGMISPDELKNGVAVIGNVTKTAIEKLDA